MEQCTLLQARRLAEELLKAIQDFGFVWEGNSFKLGVSIGLVPIDGTSGDITRVMKAADSACYAAKDQGRNRIHVYHEDDAELAVRHGEMQWVGRIHRALEQARFHLFYQPIVSLRQREEAAQHYELLLRMDDEAGRLVLPDAFLPAAERYHLSTRLDRWVTSTALDWLGRHGRHLDQLQLCAINLSGHSLGDEEFLKFVIDQFASANVPPEKICFEVTETAAIANLTQARRYMRAVKELGCRFSLDDFGSGLSSFAYLKALPVDFVKVDGVFVRDMVRDPINLEMVKSINGIAHAMGKQTIAEWVDDAAAYELLKLPEVGVDFVQGYAVGEPRPLEEIE